MSPATMPHHAAPSRHRYSLGRVIDALTCNRALDGLEGEVNDEISRIHGPSTRGCWVPFDIAASPERRDLTTSTGAGSITTRPSPTILDTLRARMVLAALGATVVDDIPPGRLQLANLTTSANFAFVAEGSSPTQAAPVIGSTVLTPYQLIGYCDVSRSVRWSAGAALDSILAFDLARGLASQIDRVAIAGAGAGSNEPDGLISNTDVPTVPMGTNGAVVSWAKLCEAEETIAANLGEESLSPARGIVTTPKARRSMRVVEKAAGAGPIWGDDNRVLGMPAYATTNVPSNLAKGSGTGLSGLLMGDWSMLVVGLWSPGLELYVDPFKFSAVGGYRISAAASLDVKCRKPKSFCRLIDVLA